MTRTEEHCTVSLLTCRNFFVSVSVFSLFNFSFVVVIVFPGLQQTKQTNERTNKEKKSSKHNLQLGIMRRNVKKDPLFVFSFFLTKKWKNKNCDDDSLAKQTNKKVTKLTRQKKSNKKNSFSSFMNTNKKSRHQKR